jgi:hypothetical protein
MERPMQVSTPERERYICTSGFCRGSARTLQIRPGGGVHERQLDGRRLTEGFFPVVGSCKQLAGEWRRERWRLHRDRPTAATLQ